MQILALAGNLRLRANVVLRRSGESPNFPQRLDDLQELRRGCTAEALSFSALIRVRTARGSPTYK